MSADEQNTKPPDAEIDPSLSGHLTLAVAGIVIGPNALAGDQYVADVIPARPFEDVFRRRGYRPETLSRIVEDNGAVTSVPIPMKHIPTDASDTAAYRIGLAR